MKIKKIYQDAANSTKGLIKAIEGITAENDTETTYSPLELEKGKCKCCLEKSNEILIGDGRCVDCIEEENFYNNTMKGI